MLSRRLQNILTYISVLGINSEEIDIRYSNTSLKFGRVLLFPAQYCSNVVCSRQALLNSGSEVGCLHMYM